MRLVENGSGGLGRGEFELGAFALGARSGILARGGFGFLWGAFCWVLVYQHFKTTECVFNKPVISESILLDIHSRFTGGDSNLCGLS